MTFIIITVRKNGEINKDLIKKKSSNHFFYYNFKVRIPVGKNRYRIEKKRFLIDINRNKNYR